MPKIPALRRSAPTVRFIALEILTTGVLAVECVFNWRTSSLVHGFETRRATLFDIILVLHLEAAHIKPRQRNFKRTGMNPGLNCIHEITL
jgi:hypothetical protein